MLYSVNYEQLINRLIRVNNPKIIGLLYYNHITSIVANWESLALSQKQLKILLTTFPGKKKDLILLPANSVRKFTVASFPLKKDQTLGLHSTLIDENGKRKYWLMLDLAAAPSKKDLAKIKVYLTSLLKVLKIKMDGYLIETDNSYHFLGEKPITKLIFAKFLQAVIKSSGGGLVDVGFCAHGLDKNLDICLRIQKRPNGKDLKVVVRI